MRVENGKKYQVVAECHQFGDDGNSRTSKFILFPGEEYTVEFLFERSGIAYVHLGTFENEIGEKMERIVSLELFVNCFEEK